MKRKGVTIILTLTLLAVLFYGYRYLKIPVETKTASMTRIEDTIRAKAYVIRTEEVFDAEITGTMYNYAEEGDRVAKNMCISTVYKGNVDADLIRDLNNVNNSIQKIQESKEKSEQIITDSGSGDYTVEKVKTDIINAVINGNIQEIEGFKNTLRALNHEEADEFDTSLNALNDQREKIEAK